MKRLYFFKSDTFFKISIILIGAFFFCLGIFTDWLIDGLDISNIFKVVGQVLIVIALLMTIIRKRQIMYSRKNMTIRLSYLGGKSFWFKNVEKVCLNDGILTLEQNDEKNLSFNLKEIRKEDKERLMQLLENYLPAKTVAV